MFTRRSMVNLDRSRDSSPVLLADREEDSRERVDHVSQHTFVMQNFENPIPIPSYQGRISLLNPDEQTKKLDFVGRVAMGMNRQEAEEKADGVERVGGYVFYPDRREFNPEDYLVQGKAPLWFTSQIGGGIGRSVDMTKEVDDEDKQTEIDVERQQQFDLAFAKMKFKLNLSKDAIVTYNIARHSIVIHDRDGKISGKYDLKDLGISEDFTHPIQGGGGLKQLLRDFGTVLTEDQIREFSHELEGLNREMKKIIEPETGGRLGYVFEVGNKGNIQGLVPFVAFGNAAKNVLYKDDRRGFFVKTMKNLKLVETNDETWPRSAVHTLTLEGAAAVADIEKAVALQNIIMQNIARKKEDLAQEIEHFTPLYPALATQQEREQISALEKEIQELNRIKDEMTGLIPSISGRIRALNTEIQSLSNPLKKFLAEQEIKRLTGENRRIEAAHSTVLHLLLMQLNSRVKIVHKQRGGPGGRLVQTQTTMPAKKFLEKMLERDRPQFGVDLLNTLGADSVRNDLIDAVANSVATGFETTVREEHASRTHHNWFKSKPMDLDPNHPTHKEIQQLGTNMGALVHDIAARTSTDPSDTRKIRFIKGRPESVFARESRSLEFLVAAAIFNGQAGIRGYDRESETIREVVKDSLNQFRARVQRPSYHQGDNFDAVKKVILEWESEIRKAALRA
ncbi:MAG: hypothetical protein QNJ27_01360 [Simkaniaceae bacterium]|nr:hypothetical protein [Simkaniaceae bacterium]